jgi:phosphate transport system substrate-binding protein
VLALRREAQARPILPTSATVRDGSYPLARTLNFATAGPPVGAAKAFLDHCLGPKGQSLVQRAGYVAMASSE